jgi:hypothetical protein
MAGAVLGLLLTIIGNGYQATADKDPDAVSILPAGIDWRTIAGIAVTTGALFFAHNNTKDATAAVAVKEKEVEQAAKAPPVNGNNQPSGHYTLTVAASQFAQAGNFAAAKACLDVAEQHKPAGLPIFLGVPTAPTIGAQS